MHTYTSQGIVYSLVIAKSAVTDLAEIGATDPDTEDEIYTLLEHIEGSQILLAELTVKHYKSEPDTGFDWDVDRWEEQQGQGRNLLRLKSWDLERLGIQYRIVYGFDNRISRFFVLAVLPRDYAYDESHPRVKKLLALYDSLGIPSYYLG